MADDKKSAGNRVDGWFAKIIKDITKKIEYFVAFLFFVITLSLWAGMFIVTHYPQQAMLALLLTAAAGLIAYYNRAFAIGVFVVMLILVFIL